MKRMLLMTIATIALAASHAWAQDNQQSAEERPAMASYWGDTGLWFLPTAEVVRPKGWSFSLYRTEFDFKQGRTDVEDWPVTAAIGVGSRLELFGALRAVTRIDRDTRPLFQPGGEQEVSGLVNDRPFVRDPWTGGHLGDLYVGAKGNLLSEQNQHPVAVALRGTIKLPTADDESGAGTGEFDYFGDVVVSKEVRRRVEVSGFGGFAIRGDPADISLSDGFRWGVGAAFGARSNLRLTTEVFGELGVDSTVDTVPGTLTGSDGSAAPTVSRLDQGVTSAVGVTWQHRSGLALGAGLTFQTGINFGDDQRSGFGMQFRLGFHRGVRVFVAPPPPPPRAAAPEPPPPVTAPPPAPPAPVANRQPAIQAQCNPCRIEVGRSVQIRVDGKDPDGDQLLYRWSAKGGTIADTRAAATTWTAETVPGTVPLVVTVEDGRGGVATSTINIEVIGAPVTELADVQFELNRFELRPDAIAALDRAVEALKQNPGMRLRVEGHASEEATAEYNLALGERRANAVRDYLVSRGVAATRLNTVSYGETRPKYDNSREETRRLNRRAALVVEAGK